MVLWAVAFPVRSLSRMALPVRDIGAPTTRPRLTHLGAARPVERIHGGHIHCGSALVTRDPASRGQRRR